jgi:hypothetical protein
MEGIARSRPAVSGKMAVLIIKHKPFALCMLTSFRREAVMLHLEHSEKKPVCDWYVRMAVKTIP